MQINQHMYANVKLVSNTTVFIFLLIHVCLNLLFISFICNLILPVSHWSPSKSSEQLHWYPPNKFTHVPLFQHGEISHSSTSVTKKENFSHQLWNGIIAWSYTVNKVCFDIIPSSQNSPQYPRGQTHEKFPKLELQVPPLRHETFLQLSSSVTKYNATSNNWLNMVLFRVFWFQKGFCTCLTIIPWPSCFTQTRIRGILSNTDAIVLAGMLTT